jgi:radical SAM protein with 4Fe4S-binding SPASM domain
MGLLINKNIGDSLCLFSLHNYGGGMSYANNLGEVVYTCNYPWRTIMILFDGKIVLCCMDFDGVQVVGDANKNNIEEIWNNERYKQVREDFKKLRYNKYPVCMKCDVIR